MKKGLKLMARSMSARYALSPPPLRNLSCNPILESSCDGINPVTPSPFAYNNGVPSSPLCLAPQDLSAIFSHDAPDSPVNLDIDEVYDPKVFPAVSMFHEKACLDETCRSQRKFMKLYDVKERFTRGKGSANINIAEKPNDGSPSAPIFNNPTEGVEVVLDAVFRTRLSMKDTSTVFTSWVACPSSGMQRSAICYTSGNCYAANYYGLNYNSDGGDFHWKEGSGCFGSHVRVNDLWRGFDIGTKPLAVVYNNNEDLSCFQASIPDADFLLPCSAEEIYTGGFVISFGYPCVNQFLYEARGELISKDKDYGIAKLYEGLAANGAELYSLLHETFGSFSDGQLLCSPGILTFHDGNNLHIKSSMLKGSSGSPIIPAGLPGYTVGVHRGGAHADINVAMSTDSLAFVDSYKRHILPYLPSPTDAIFCFRDLNPFYRWLDKHGLTWCNHEDIESKSSTGGF